MKYSHCTQLSFAFIIYSAHARASECLQGTGLLHAPPKSVQGDLGLADTDKAASALHTKTDVGKKNRHSEKYKNFLNTLVPNNGNPPGVRGFVCPLCVQNGHLEKLEAIKDVDTITAQRQKKILHQNLQNPCSEICLHKKTKDIPENTQRGIAAKATQKNLLWTDPQGAAALKLMYRVFSALNVPSTEL